MNQKAVIENRDYRLPEPVPSLIGQGQFVLCEDSNGNKFVYSEEFWFRHAHKSEATAPVHAGSASQETIAFFLSLFRERVNLYARSYTPASV